MLMAEPALGASRRVINRGSVLIRGAVVATEEGGGRALDAAYRTAVGVEQLSQAV